MIPASMLMRTDISATTKLIFAALAMESYNSGRVAISHQALAVRCGCSRAQALASLKILTERELIKPDGPRVSQVQPYELVDASAEYSSAAPAVIDTRKRKPGISCPNCHKPRPALLKVGICRSCNWELKVRRIARDELRATA